MGRGWVDESLGPKPRPNQIYPAQPNQPNPTRPNSTETRTGDLRAGVGDADEAREDVLGEHVGVALLRQVVRVDVDLCWG